MFIKFLVLFFLFLKTLTAEYCLISSSWYHYCVVYYGFLRVLQTIIFHIAICYFVAFCINIIIITLCTLTEKQEQIYCTKHEISHFGLFATNILCISLFEMKMMVLFLHISRFLQQKWVSLIAKLINKYIIFIVVFWIHL